MTDLNIPEPIAAYFEADQRDGEALARCFTNEAVVKDEGQTHRGPGGHQGVEDRSVWQVLVHQRTLRRGEEGRPVHRHEPCDGRFPGQPGRPAISLPPERGKIASLEITP